jgi:hypothetical protein
MADVFKKPTPEERKRDGQKALVEYRAEEEARNKNMARLRAARLEREANNPVPKKAVTKAATKKAGKLTDYLKQEKDGGRHT